MSFSNKKKSKLSENAIVTPGFAFKSTDFGDYGFPVVKIADINPPRVDLNNCQRIHPDKVQGLDKFKLTNGDIVIAMTGATLGKVGRIKEDITAYLNQRVVKITNIPTLTDKGFLYYLVTLKENNSKIIELGLGSAQANFSGKDLENLEFYFPDLSTQTTISAILTSIDDKIELNFQTNQTLENLTQAIFKDWFVNFNFPGATGEMHDSELGPIPNGWRVGRLGDIIRNYDSKRIPLSSREREKRKGTFPYYGAASIMDYIDDFIFDGTYLLMGEDGTVITEKDRPVLQYVTGKFWVNNHAHVIQGGNNFSTEYVYLLLKNTNIKHIITGAVQPKINQANMNELSILCPGLSVLSNFQSIIASLFLRVLTNEQESIILARIRDDLLPKLMKGEIEV